MSIEITNYCRKLNQSQLLTLHSYNCLDNILYMYPLVIDNDDYNMVYTIIHSVQN